MARSGPWAIFLHYSIIKAAGNGQFHSEERLPRAKSASCWRKGFGNGQILSGLLSPRPLWQSELFPETLFEAGDIGYGEILKVLTSVHEALGWIPCMVVNVCFQKVEVEESKVQSQPTPLDHDKTKKQTPRLTPQSIQKLRPLDRLRLLTPEAVSW